MGNESYLCVEGKCLKEAFPRCFALAEKKNGVVKDFGVWSGQKWAWGIPTRRPPFDWEKNQWQLFTTFLDCIQIRRQFPDTIAWSAKPNGIFSIGSFRRSLEQPDEDVISAPLFFWKGICPPKMEMFLWQLWRGKVLVRDVLYQSGMANLLSLDCPLCCLEKESIDHLFLHCTWSKRLWLDSMAWWGVVGCFNKTVKGWLDGWTGLCPAIKNERAWNSLFCSIAWTIWENRNHLVFEGKVPVVEQAVDLVKFLIVWWFKYLGKGIHDNVQSLLLNVKELCVETRKQKQKKIIDWIPPMTDTLKFNVDGSVRGKPGPAGIGGVLRNSNGKVLCLFSYYMGRADSNAAEIWAIKRAVELCLSNPMLRGRDIEVVSDSKVAVSWVTKEDFGNLAYVDAIYDIQSGINYHGCLEAVYNSRAFNSFADSPAKMGSNMLGDFVEWGDF
ncbi:hypothetical protein Dsin_013947 [Dipteronia sinensis]|uniref:RNase H type-1 domain-containing protein n=1 Tax=Dipteronia sinensis TaxID=43782 RepID=A0AAE0ALC0_9ROSI|nr:hypothetical protein Dsin_013947 [Dipteronia sinensis]